MARKRAMSQKQLQAVKDLNKRLSKKKSNLKQRHGVAVEIPRIDTNLKGKELKQAIQRVESFLNPNANKYNVVTPKGVQIPANEFFQAEKLIKKANRKKEKARKKLMELDYTVRGEVIGKAWQTKYANLDEMDEFLPIKMNLNWFNSLEDFRNWVSGKKDVYGKDFLTTQRERYRTNYLNTMYNVMGFTNETEAIYNKVMGMSVNDFYMVSMSTDEGHINYFYEVKFRDERDVMSDVYNVWMNRNQF